MTTTQVTDQQEQDALNAIGDNNAIQEPQAQAENQQGEDIDWEAKAKEAEAKAVDLERQRNKISEDFKNQVSRSDRLQSSLENTMAQIGAKLDKNGNVIFTPQEKKDDPIAQLSNQKEQLIQKYNNGDIDDASYFDQVSRINAQITAEEYTKRQQEEQQKQQEQQTIEAKRQKAQSKLNQQFPTLQDKESALSKKFLEVYNENEDFYDVNSPIDHLKMAQIANSRLIAEGVQSQEQSMQRQQQRLSDHHVLNSGPHTPAPQTRTGFTEEHKSMMFNSGLSKKDVESMLKSNQHLQYQPERGLYGDMQIQI